MTVSTLRYAHARLDAAWRGWCDEVLSEITAGRSIQEIADQIGCSAAELEGALGLRKKEEEA